MPKIKNIFNPGDKFDMLTVIKEVSPLFDKYQKRRRVKCKCDCGKITIRYVADLFTKRRKSCGCLKKDNPWGTHRLSGHPLYRVWRNIISRCYNKNCNHYHNYGGRGVRMCKEWKNDFKTFYDWANTVFVQYILQW